ncbi:MAG: FAD-dependent oxidoreductase, partial [Planctomycetaceae bacterium]
MSGAVRFQLGTAIRAIQQAVDEAAGWLVQTDGQQHAFDAVIVTLPTWQAARLLSGQQFQDLRQQLDGIEYASSAIVVSGHQLSDFSYPMDAFGMVVPACEKRKILAVSFSSRKFAERAPDGQIVLRTFV